MEYLPLITCIVIEFYYQKPVNGFIWFLVVTLAVLGNGYLVKTVHEHRDK